MRIRVNVDGEKRLLKYLSRLGPDAAVVGKDVLGKVVADLVPRIKAVTPVQPVDGGELRQSVRKSVRINKRTGRVAASVIAGGRLTAEPGKKNVYASVQEAGEARIHGQLVRFSHTVGQSPFMEQEVFKAAAKVPDKLRAAITRKLKP